MAELLAANQITIAKVLDGETGADGYSPTVTTGTSSDGSTTVTVTNKDGSTTTELVDGTARVDIDTLSDKTRSGYIETLSGNGFVQSTKTEDGGASEVVVYGKSEQLVPDSPSPEYHSEIQSVENPKVTVTAKNLLGGEALANVIVEKGGTKNLSNKTVQWQCSAVDGKSMIDSIKFKENTQYTFVFYGKCLYESAKYTNLKIYYTDGSVHTLSDFEKTNDFSSSITRSVKDKTVKEVRFSWYSTGTILEYEKCGIFEGAITAEQFEPYKGKTATLSDIVLRSTPDGTRDRLFKDTDGLWKVDRKYGIVDLGTLTWTYHSTYAVFMVNVNTYASFPTPGPNNMGMCSKYLVHRSVVASELANYDDTIFICPDDWSTSKYLVVRDTSYTDATTFKSAMSGAMLVYELAMPTYETLPDSIQAELNALTTYNPITNVFVSAGVTPDIDVSFWTRDYYAKNAADNAAKVATNFLGYDSTNGLIIGNKTSGTWSGYRSQILPGSFNVLDESSTVLASFGTTTVIGEEANANMHLTFNNFSMVDKNGTKFFEVGDSRNADGIATLQWSSPDVPIDTSGSVTITVGNTISSIVSVYVDSVELSSSSYSFSGEEVTINNLTASSTKYIEIIYNTTDSAYYLTFGNRWSSSIIGEYSIAEGKSVTASGFASHAEGLGTKAIGAYSHAEGAHTKAKGAYSHAGGYQTVADNSHMTVVGTYNTENSGKAFVVGVGDFINRRDGFTVDWDGNATVRGSLTLGKALSIANGGTGATTAAAARTNLGLSGAQIKTLLWTNASPTSAFAAQTLDSSDGIPDLSGYDAIEIEYYGSTTVAASYIIKSKIGEPFFLFGYLNPQSTSAHINLLSRSVSTATSGITFEGGFSKRTSDSTVYSNNNNYCIPYKIYGIKVV